MLKARRAGVLVAYSAVSLSVAVGCGSTATKPTVSMPRTAKTAHVLPPSPGSLKGTIALVLNGGSVHGYSASLAGNVGTPHGTEDLLTFSLRKTMGAVIEEHAWAVKLTAGEVRIRRSKATITVHDPLGVGGADGELNFTFIGTRQRPTAFPCGATHNEVEGTLDGTIRIRVRDHFFKTVTVHHMTGTAIGTYDSHVCLAACPRPYYFVQVTGSYSPTRPSVDLEARTQPPKGENSVSVSVFDPVAGTPFIQISHVLDAVGPESHYSSTPSMSSGSVTTPGGALAGSLTLQASGGLKSEGSTGCKGGPQKLSGRSAKVVGGRIMANFDSIGRFSIATNLNEGAPGLTELAHAL